MSKRIHIHKDGTQALVDGPLNIRSNTKEVVKEYEVDIPDKDFKELMTEPQKVRLKSIKNKRRLMVK